MKVKLGDCAQLIKSRVDTEEALEDSYVSTDNMLPNRGGIKFGDSNLPKSKTVNDYQKGDILVSNIRPYFKKIWFADRNGTRSGDVLCFRARNVGILDEYLYCVLQSDSFFNYVVATSKGTKMPRGDKKAILNYEFDLPSREEQYKKCNPILLIEKKNCLNNQINDNLTKLRNLQYRQLINSNTVRKVKITELFNIFYGKSLPKSKLINSGIQVFGANGLMGYTSEPSIIEKPTVTITSRGSGSGYVSYLDVGKAFLTNNLLYLDDKNNLGLSFAFETIKASNPNQFVTGSAQPQLTIKNLSQLDITVPVDRAVIDEFRKEMHPIESTMRNNNLENYELKKLKDTLICKYFKQLNYHLSY